MTNWRRYREQVPQRQETRFAWLPVRLYELRSPYWRMTGKLVWLRRARVVRNMFGDVFHVAIKN